MSSASACILLFVKAPQLGRVKSRLAASIGEWHATQVYRQFGHDLMTMLRSLPAVLRIYYSPTTELTLVQEWLGQEHTYYPQVGVDLGDRMAHAFQQTFATGFQQVLIVGSDSPDLPMAYLMQGLEQLQQPQVVIGPARDGGYYTLGFTQTTFLPEVFQNMTWSTSTVLATTLQTLQRHQRQVVQLPIWYDVDTLTELLYLYQQADAAAPQTYTLQYLQQHQHEIFGQFVA